MMNSKYIFFTYLFLALLHTPAFAQEDLSNTEQMRVEEIEEDSGTFVERFKEELEEQYAEELAEEEIEKVVEKVNGSNKEQEPGIVELRTKEEQKALLRKGPVKNAQLPFTSYALFDDRELLRRGAIEYSNHSKDVLLAMIADDNLPSPYQRAAAIRVFKEEYSREMFNKAKKAAEKILLRRLNRTTSPFVQVEIMHTLCLMDRYQYFKSMTPALIAKLDHYNATINEMAYTALDDIIKSGNNRAREARIMFNTMRKVLFLSRKRLENIKKPDQKLVYKLKIVRWSIKVLGNDELKRLPKEVLPLL